MQGVARRDYQLHSRHFSVSLKSTISAEDFLVACDQREQQWGLPHERTLVCIFRKPKSFTLVWNQSYSKTEAGQVMAVTTVALKGGRYFVDGFFLQ